VSGDWMSCLSSGLKVSGVRVDVLADDEVEAEGCWTATMQERSERKTRCRL